MITGLAMVFGATIPYIVSYYRMYLKNDVTYDTFQPLQALSECFASVSYPISNAMIEKLFGSNSRPVIFIGALVGLGFQFTCVSVPAGP